eukprot:10298968-Lingulodinium_polyedra.AAC.1
MAGRRSAASAEVEQRGIEIAPAAPSQNAAFSQGPRKIPEMRRPFPTGATRYQQVGSAVGVGSFGRVWLA